MTEEEVEATILLANNIKAANENLDMGRLNTKKRGLGKEWSCFRLSPFTLLLSERARILFMTVTDHSSRSLALLANWPAFMTMAKASN